jgi:UDP:flavonoid glycosyltransferase YjiC (YdhE family)
LAKVLLGWELGSGLGHVIPPRDIARRLAADGHEPEMVFENVVDSAALFEPGEFPLLQAPSWHGRPHGIAGDMSAATYADVLAVEGFRSAEAIATIVEGWDRLLDLIQPDLVISNAGPALTLAARGRVPAIVIGNGFAMPPSELDFLPPLQPGARPAVRQADLVAAINQVQTSRGRPMLPALPALFDGEERYILTLATLDPYADHRQAPADGPLTPYAGPAPLPPSDSVFAYIDADQPNLRMIMEGLGSIGLPTRVCVRGAPASAVEDLATGTVTVLAEVPDLAAAIRGASVVVHDGGLFTASTALSVGRPQMILPRGLERHLTALRIQELGTGVTVMGLFSAPQFATLLTSAANSGRMSRRALEVAGDLARAERRDLLSEIAESCEILLATV